jgi:hypothetical protein
MLEYWVFFGIGSNLVFNGPLFSREWLLANFTQILE